MESLYLIASLNINRLESRLSIMKKIIIAISLFFAVFCMSVQCIAQPKAVIDNSIFTFETVPEGVHVTHEFIIRNTGDTVLNINKVLPP